MHASSEEWYKCAGCVNVMKTLINWKCSCRAFFKN